MFGKWLRRGNDRGEASTAVLGRAQALRMRNDFDAARQVCGELLRREPDNAGALALMAAIAADQRDIEQGLAWAERALRADPACVPGHFARGRLYEAAERYEDAAASYRRATELDPANAKAQTNLGCMLHLQGRIEEAVACYRSALRLEPDQPEALRNYALVAGGAQEVGEAVRGFERLVAAQPADAAAQLQLGHLYLQLGRHEDALHRYQEAIALEPQRPEFHFARAQALLLLGHYREGWQEYEWRWRMELLNDAMFRQPYPRWDGRPLEGTLLLHGESAFGDALQFVRYATLAARRCKRVVVECPPALQALVAQVPGVAEAVPEGGRLPHIDVQLPLIACPGVFETALETIPWDGPYVSADPARVALWRDRLAAAGARARKVGLVWTGNPGNFGNRGRSVSVQHLSRLAEVPGISFVSLQKGGPDARPGPIPDGMHFIDLTEQIGDFSDTAALLAQLDLVVSVDTSVAHLAGAMGRPVWMLLPFSADWRYHVGRSDNPWYPTMRLFRQAEEGQWDLPLEQLRLAFGEWALR